MLDLDNSDLAWPLRACRGVEDSCEPHSTRESVKTTARRLVRGSPECDASFDFWPGQKTFNRPAAGSTVAEPQAEPSDVLSDRAVALDAELALHARRRQSASGLRTFPSVLRCVRWVCPRTVLRWRSRTWALLRGGM